MTPRSLRGLLGLGLAALASTVALTWVAWSGATASMAAARAASREQARTESQAAGRRVVAELAAAAGQSFDALLTAAPDALPRAWEARKDIPAPVAALLLLDDRGRVVYPRAPTPPPTPWVDEREVDESARARLREAYAAEFGRHDPDAAAAAYEACLDERFGRTVRLEALVNLAALELRRGRRARAGELFDRILDPRQFPAKFVAVDTRFFALFGRVRALLAPETAVAAAAALEAALGALLAEPVELEPGALRLFRRQGVELIAQATASGPAPALEPLRARLLQQAEAEGHGAAPDLAERLAPLVRAAGPASASREIHWLTLHAGDFPTLAAWRAVPSSRGAFAAAFEWTADARQEAVRRALAAEPSAALAATLCDLAGRPLAGGAVPSEPPTALTAIEEIPGWSVRVDLRDPAALERSLSRQRLAVVAVALIFLAVTLASLAALLRVARREMELAALKSDFVAHVSHELKTPLSVIRMFAETLALGRVSGDAQRKEYLETMARESERLTAMIDNILDFSRIEQGRRVYRFEPVDLAALLRETADAAQARLAAQGFAVTLDLEGVPEIRADRAALASAVANLVDNAAKYSECEKSIAVIARPCLEGVEIRIADRGIGIPPGERERIFEPFVRGADERVARRKGSGLGLALVKHVVEAHGGTIRAGPHEGGGSVFAIRLPA